MDLEPASDVRLPLDQQDSSIAGSTNSEQEEQSPRVVLLTHSPPPAAPPPRMTPGEAPHQPPSSDAMIDIEAEKSIHKESSVYLKMRETERRKDIHEKLRDVVRSMARLHRVRVPALSWLRRYRVLDLGWDINAGVVVGVLLIPQGMAYSILAGLPPVYGLYTGIIPTATYALLGTSRHNSLAGMALVSMMVTTALLKLAPDPHDEASCVLTAIHLSFLVGLIQMSFGLFRLGAVVQYISYPVLSAINTGGGLLIMISQLKYVLGIKSPAFPHAYQTIYYLGDHIGKADYRAFLLWLCCFSILYASSWWKRTKKPTGTRLNSALRMACNFTLILVIFMATVMTYVIEKTGGAKMQKIGKIPGGFKTLNPWSMTSYDHFVNLLPSAFLLAAVSFLITFGVAAKYAVLKRYEIDTNQDLVAVGLANILGSFFGTFPVAAGFARTAVNVEAGARTQLSSLVAALMVLFSLTLLTSLFYYIPMAALAALIQNAIISSFDFAPYIQAYSCPTSDFFVMTATTVLTLVLGINSGIFGGLGLSICALLLKDSFPAVKTLGRLAGDSLFRDLQGYPDGIEVGYIKVLRLESPLTFVNTSFVKEQLLRVARAMELGASTPEPRPSCALFLVLDAAAVSNLDFSGLVMLTETATDLEAHHVKLLLADTNAGVRDILRSSPKVYERLGGDKMYLSVEKLVDILQGHYPANSMPIRP